MDDVHPRTAPMNRRAVLTGIAAFGVGALAAAIPGMALASGRPF